ncbi:MAG: hypothetical protein ACJA0S_000231 [Rickettsiales bacterium]|jgi:hypothetical protein
MNFTEENVMSIALNLLGVIAKKRLVKLNLLANNKFVLHLKESEFRLNKRK